MMLKLVCIVLGRKKKNAVKQASIINNAYYNQLSTHKPMEIKVKSMVPKKRPTGLRRKEIFN